jgi:hypothetical protein
MAGMNLSSSTPEIMSKPKRRLDSYFMLVTVVFFLTIIGFGGLRWYINKLDVNLAGFDAVLAEHAKQLQGETVDRVARFDDRMTLVGKQLSDDQGVDSQKLLSQLEGLVVPNIKLTKYEYNDVGKFVEVKGLADNFKSVAQQLISFKSEPLFVGINVQSLSINNDKLVEFVFRADFN